MGFLRLLVIVVFSVGVLFVPVSSISAEGSDVSVWAKKVKLNGDLRLRNEYKASEPGIDTDRQNMRFRLGGLAVPVDKVRVGFGLATGSSDSPVSTNQTFEREFQKKQIWLDYAYADYKPYSWLKIIGGKFKSPFFHTDMLWDSDVRFEGFAAKIKTTMPKEKRGIKELYVSGGYFPVDNLGTHDKDLYLLVGEGGLKAKCPVTGINVKLGVSYFSFENFKGVMDTGFVESAGTNTYEKSGQSDVLKNGYKVLAPTMELSLKNFGGIIGEYANNSETAKANDAYRAGAWLGVSKVKKKGDWKLLGQFSFVERDAFFDAFPDAAFNYGGTNGKGWKAVYNLCLAKNVIFGVNYYKTRQISGVQKDQKILHTEFVLMF